MIGHRVWAIAEGYMPGRSFSDQRELISHEAACILNAADTPASVGRRFPASRQARPSSPRGPTTSKSR